jgi:ferrochelatase
MATERHAVGVLLVNLGTPDSPSTPDVRRYLREFLGDPRVLTMPAAARWLLLNGIILRTRPRRSAAAYRKIWLPGGSPLLLHSRSLRDAVAARLGSGYIVELAMRYGTPNIPSAIESLEQAGASRLIVLPLFPQFSEAVTGSTLARVEECIEATGSTLSVSEISDFYAEPGYVASIAAIAGPRLRAFGPDHVLLSYHGLPEAHLRGDPRNKGCLQRDDCCAKIATDNRSCYRAQCFATSRALRESLGLPEERCSTSFQSRLGRQPWIQPHTDEVVTDFAASGVKRLAVICPAFVADNLETLEEIGIRLRQQWLDLGGTGFELCPCPNEVPEWIDAVCQMVTRAEASAES